VADFGLARSLLEYKANEEASVENPVLTDYVATRWYRAPEILAGSSTYGTPVDLWSVGCIFGEMLGGKPVFPGTSTLNQLESIGNTLGAPTVSDCDGLNSTFTLGMLDGMKFPTKPLGERGDADVVQFDKQEPPADPADAQAVRTYHETSWKYNYPPAKASDDAIDLLCKLMKYHPGERMTAAEGLLHPYCAQFHDEASEVAFEPSLGETQLATNIFPESDKAELKREAFHDNKKLSTGAYRDKLYSVIKDQGKIKQAPKR